jgi:hypothetical protein
MSSMCEQLAVDRVRWRRLLLVGEEAEDVIMEGGFEEQVHVQVSREVRHEVIRLYLHQLAVALQQLTTEFKEGRHPRQIALQKAEHVRPHHEYHRVHALHVEALYERGLLATGLSAPQQPSQQATQLRARVAVLSRLVGVALQLH